MMASSVIREMLKITDAHPDVISLAGGSPSYQSFPVEEIAAACAAVLRRDSDTALQYGVSEGYTPLREAVAEMLPWAVDPARVLITSGSQQGLDLASKVLIDPGSKVLMEAPTFLGALLTFRAMQANVVGVASDAEGVIADDLVDKAKDARFAYLLPNFQNPTGRTMSEARRARVAAAAEQAGLPLVEDNPYGDLWFDQPPPPPMAARNPDNTIYLGTFSKVFVPGLRLGFMVLPEALFPKVLLAKQAADIHTATFNQLVVVELMRSGFLERHVPTLRALYKRQRDAMLAALAREMDGLDVRFDAPMGGMFVWLRMPAGIDTVALLPRAVQRGVVYVPGAPFYAEDGDLRTMRLSYATASVEEIDRSVKALGETVRAALSSA
jgi:2-aminoadipate transaminase